MILASAILDKPRHIATTKNSDWWIVLCKLHLLWNRMLKENSSSTSLVSTFSYSWKIIVFLLIWCFFVAIPQNERCDAFLLSPRYHHNTYNHKQGKPTPYGMSIHFLTAVIVSLQSGDFRTFTSKKQTLLFLICLVKLLFHC